MKKLITQRLIDHRIYWAIKKRLNSYLLKARSKKYNTTNYFNSEAQNFRILRSTLSETLWLVIAAIVFAVVLQKTNAYTTPYFEHIGLSVPNDGDYVTFLSAVGGIGGVFIGLYYAALSSVGSAIYAKVPNNIRDLLTQERSGTVYMRFLSTLTLLCITLITFRVCGLPRIIAAVPIVGLLAGAGVVAFVKLGKNAFNLFDPTALSHHVFEDIQKSLSLVQVNGYRWSDPAFQNHAYKKASRSIETLRLLIEIAVKETHQNGRSLVKLICYTLDFLSNYELMKKNIPSNSYWYPEQFKHKDWYATPGYNVKIAHITGTSLQPDMVRRHHWIEEQLHPYILRSLSVNLAEGRHLEAMQVLSKIESYVSVLAYTGDITKAFDLIDQISKTAIEAFALEPEKPKLAKIETLSIIEAIATLPISIALNMAQHVSNNSRAILSEKTSKINWHTKSSIYAQNIPTHLIPQTEWLQTRIDFEKTTERRIISPSWYQLEIILLAEAKTLAKYIEEFPKRSKKYYNNLAEELQKLPNPWLYAAAQSREHEFWHKAERTVELLSNNWLEIENKRLIQGLPWPIVDISITEQSLHSNQKALIKAMAAQGIILADAEVPPEYPDYAGQFLHITGEALFSALCSNDASLIKNLFGIYILGCFSRFERLKPKNGETENAEHKLHIASAAIMDLMELSGYAKLLSELHQNIKIWENVKDTWNHLIKDEQGKTITAYLNLIIKFSRAAYAIPHRSELRFEWEREINSLLEKIPREEVQANHDFFLERVAVHPSKLVQFSAKDRYQHLPSGLNIFIVFFFIELEGQENFELDWEQRDLLKLVEKDRKVQGGENL
ncbi:hypothetical protein C1Y08_13140 [Pseudomonas sp. FW306-02-F02-AA]|uniref:Uncharacterized protein n=1 Tax=Pseudomonas fluorescens TaxID=294 RepID=A0A0N7H088_PSEFL|nr:MULTISPECIES: hypothetical protein [Pseudomonas]ALI02460.1 hypothetical protein AO353_15770 [Pseudomonas fluorescens]PMZ03715.1 hypothetical protein C1Y07_12580 [Pseudomonas sp. FW306-02-F02-AB]PMZ10420.1 hypothetical protein C1Y06_08720 [Pseudomonas sp. FW306-02-H06C]PMZ15574.1 hypothetical protein C1Y08_13140 [Pseudomonas sp. FW306-02-F02-AA]PMZ22654.1 hypothetical protein C1Y09_06070 [Pseudomonas sp. FW306-02-F08-AA]